MAQGFQNSSMFIYDDRWLGPPPGVELSYATTRPTVIVVGVVDRAKVTEVSGILRGLVADGVPEVVVDITHACDGAELLPVLASTRHRLAQNGGALLLVGVAVPEFLAALHGAPLEEVFLVYDAVRRDTDERSARRRCPPLVGPAS